MSYRYISLLIFLVSTFTSISYVNAQEVKTIKTYEEQKPLSLYDSIGLISLPKLTFTKSFNGKSPPPLPVEVDNSVLEYWRPVFAQVALECGQASGIGLGFTYAINRERNLPSSDEENQYTPHFTWNYTNGGDGYYGVSYFHSFEIVRTLGNSDIQTYGGMFSPSPYNMWMNGYDNYYLAMNNRISEVYQIDVSTEEGILTAKHWLHNHLEGSDIGGVANFYANSPSDDYTLPAGTPEAGKYVVTSWGGANHAMTISGYHDEICWDYNSDGQFTNNIDINNDGIVNVRDWEIGGFRFANTYNGGPIWANEGFSYMTYKSCADPSESGGIWNNSIHVLYAKENCSPQLTAKITLKHICRNQIRVRMGVSKDQTAETPDYIVGFPVFDFHGGCQYMQGGETIEENKIIEFGLDLTPLLNLIGTNIPARYFLLVDENDPNNWNGGKVIQFSIIDYTDGVVEIESEQNNVLINNDSLTKLWVDHTVTYNPVVIDMDTLPSATVFEPYSAQLQATGGTDPYFWNLDLNYTETSGGESFPNINEEQLYPGSSYTTKQLDFDFPFYGESFNQVRVYKDGYIMFENMFNWPYDVYDFFTFTKNKHIAPFMAALTFSTGDGLWYDGNENSAIFRWKASQSDYPTTTELNFAVELKKNGDIIFYYGDVNEFNAMEWLSGVSAGDNKYYQFTAISGHPIINPSSVINLKTSIFPESFEVSHDGILTGIPELIYDNYEMKFMAFDENNLKDSKVLFFSTAGSNYLVIDDYTILAGDDDIIEIDETVYLSVDIKNLGENSISGSEMEISIDENLITLVDSTEFLGDFEPDEIISFTNAFVFDVSDQIQNEYTLDVNTLIFDDAGSDWNSNIYLTVYAPELHIGYASIIDEGNGNLDPGETADLQVQILNIGGVTATDINTIISSADSYITINLDTNYLELIEANSIDFAIFNISAAEDTPIGHNVEFTVDYSAAYGLSGTGTVNIIVGQTPVLIVDLDDNSNSAPAMEDVLSDMGITFESVQALPANLNLYTSIFLCLGIYSNNHVLNSTQGQNLANYLASSGKLYMEGGDTWAYDTQTAVHPMFNIDGTDDGSGDMSTVSGIAGTFTEGMSFSYSGENSWMDHLEPIDDAFVILENGSPLYNTGIAYDGGIYKTIGTSHEFGGLDDGTAPSTREVLMEKYLEFFNILSFDLIANFTANETQICSEESIEFMDISNGIINSWTWTFEGGEPGTSTLQNPVVTYNEQGIYDVILVISDGTNSDTISKSNYIVVFAYPETPVMPGGDEEVCTNLTTNSEYVTAGGSFIDAYLWELLPVEAGTISGNGPQGSVQWTPNWEGIATVKVKGENDNCGEGEFSDLLEILCEVCTGVKTNSPFSDIIIFPNPTKGELFLESKVGYKNVSLSVINPLNQVIYENQLDFTNQPLLKINLSVQSRGVYYLRIRSDEVERIEKIIVN